MVHTLLVRTAVRTATAAYTVNGALGLSVAVGAVDTSTMRWLHHGLYIATVTSTLLAIATATLRRDPSALALAPAVVPLFLLQHHGSRPLGRHARTAVLAAPCYAGALALARR
ncbi:MULTISPECIES: hypothetical protein [Brachybacterium]|uniref:Uncharacterized protein n=1 Tax=Brachybacterium alimentarium TaxID=47845 RepID=A0A2A3YJC7_9MICO|nr:MULTISPECIES: hypothetical protein [Brachybacterium]PCC39391.1 hypothetical protein CIK66_09005 [Brachybacterium alimentarium]RCS66346.1 hypothetical protein CIK81_03890 [Brachybacterium sp. JB7]RCS74558.1 hypothetical protein CIK73_00090 [Brachybacterium alimentarium]RCS75294.1 hypothetical protein CIK68_04165 [Brachybacterium alimentarium]RCS79351.1 hypothetical protein CIK72_10140 [Brachybacterium alimentarium]